MIKIVKKEVKMKKLTLGLGSLVAIAAPVSAVVACGSSETKGFSYESAEAMIARSTNTKATPTSITMATGQTGAGIASKGSTIARFVNGKYTHTSAPATATEVKAPNSIETIAAANKALGIASTGHYSILIHLLKGELSNAEALMVHSAFVTAYNSKMITTPEVNSLDAQALYTALKTAIGTTPTLATKLNLAMFA